ncbi:Down syndrome cell adhesion molecule-like protein Dscam2 [Stegodyphus dumicola]|uniref:Down syndrome cell adhesion molecule-like protein Dscam2 n=1 Tax=Stegodyphus dumicola TaxID=202533 RepID=UPI0015B27BE0|nr:Down syndrome cell adhesion molecule-like protein Dscam2 [Stegodyphus dumicola]
MSYIQMNWIFISSIITGLCMLLKSGYCNDAPLIQPFNFPENVKIGHTLSVACTVMKGKPPFKFIWHKNGNVLKEGATINTLEKVSSLIIDPVVKQSRGNYSCTVSNAFGKNSYSAFLSIRAPPSWITEPEDQETVEGLITSFTCLANGFPLPKITWKKIGITNSNGANYNILRTSINGTLTFNPTLKEYEGKYLCEVDNGAGEPLRKTFSITVHVLYL